MDRLGCIGMVFLFNKLISLALRLVIDATTPSDSSPNVKYILFFHFAINRWVPSSLLSFTPLHCTAHPPSPCFFLCIL